MITLTMTPSEMLAEAISETRVVFAVSDAKQAKVDHMIRAAKHYPAHIKSTYTSNKNNKWLLCWVANNKKMTGDDCLFYAACLLDTDEGTYVLLPQTLDGVWFLLIFTPHFFARYAERNKVKLRGTKLRHHYLLHNASYHIKPMPAHWRNYRESSLMATVTEGMIFGYQTSNRVCVITTYLSYDLAKDDQIDDVIVSEIIRKETHGY